MGWMYLKGNLEISVLYIYIEYIRIFIVENEKHINTQKCYTHSSKQEINMNNTPFQSLVSYLKTTTNFGCHLFTTCFYHFEPHSIYQKKRGQRHSSTLVDQWLDIDPLLLVENLRTNLQDVKLEAQRPQQKQI